MEIIIINENINTELVFSSYILCKMYPCNISKSLYKIICLSKLITEEEAYKNFLGRYNAPNEDYSTIQTKIKLL